MPDRSAARRVGVLPLFHPHPTGWVGAGVYAIRQRRIVSLFVVTAPGGALAIDAGTSPRGLAASLRTAGIAVENVRHLFLTHSDSDHAGGLAAFAQAQMYIGIGEEPLIRQERTRFLGLTHVPRLPAPYRTLRDGDLLEVDGVTVQAIATPGHTPGSMSYLVGGRLLFTGDALALRNGVAQPFLAPLNMQRDAVRASLRRLARLQGIELLCTAHTGCTTDWLGAMAPWRTTE